MKPQAVVGGITIKFNSFGDGIGNVWANFHGLNHIGSGQRMVQECNYIKLVQVEWGEEMKDTTHWIGGSCPVLY